MLGDDRVGASALLGLSLPAEFPAGTDDVFLQVQLARKIFASVAPTNGASLGVLNKLGFRHVGEQMDEIDGKELVFELGL
ncbi:MAG TPA: GNAT family protein [Candidatus Dormibacteraeota bacterium]|nr:GNAT family protein [Candidatus Dormibacteraeota bacterium]